MHGKIVALVACLLFFACSEQDVPQGLYDYQVERLLSGGTSKLWDLEIGSIDCQDSIKYLFELIENQSDDSLNVSQLSYSNGCSSFDTLLIGKADASSFEGSIRFTDSLLFESGDVWIIDQITSELLTLEADEKLSLRVSD